MAGLRILISLMLLSLCISCHAQVPENRKRWVDAEDRAEFVKRLKDNNIPFRVDDEGGVWYPADRTSTVDAISREVLAATAFHGTSFVNPEDSKEFSKRLDQAGIPHQQKVKLGETWITWDEKFDAQARKIRDEVDNENMRRAREAKERVRTQK